MSIFVVKSIYIQIKGQVMDYYVVSNIVMERYGFHIIISIQASDA